MATRLTFLTRDLGYKIEITTLKKVAMLNSQPI